MDSRIASGKPLQGIIPPMVTPLADDDALDVAGLEHLVEHVLAGGVSGLFILGTSGEALSLSQRLRVELIERTSRLVARRVPLLVGITDTSLVESLRLAERAAEAGATAVVLAQPPYYPVNQADLCRYVEQLVERLPLPVFLYNMPSHTKLVYEVDMVRRLLENPKIIGLKDSSGDMLYFHAVRQATAAREDFSLLMGPEELLAEAVLLGADGGVNGGANLRPELYVALYQAARDGNLPRVAQLHEQVLRIAQALYTMDQNSAGVIKGLKCALAHAGICSGRVAPPLQALNGEQQARIHQELVTLELLARETSQGFGATAKVTAMPHIVVRAPG